jgi:class 3 adenylate cyclase/DNA-binding CsgD family transcriptional regulator
VPDDAAIKTFLVADVRGYTVFTDDHGDEAAARLAKRFAELTRDAVEERGGRVVELRGDEALVVFESPRQALRGAVELQARCAQQTAADPSCPLRIGIGLDAGEAVPVEGGYRGGALNLAARLCGLAGPGEVLASRELIHLARRVDGIRYVERGPVSVKGLPEPVDVVAVGRERDHVAPQPGIAPVRTVAPLEQPTELIGRERECRMLDRLLDAAREARSGVLVLLGEPGIGKTALLEYARAQAEGMRVLQARGIASEAHVPFAGLLELLRPALGRLDRLPEPQASALGAALALRPGAASDRFAVGAATLSLLAAYADEAPLVLLVDDVHWLDVSSAEALLFAVRRLVVDPIAAITAAREGEPSPLVGADLPVLRLDGLDRDGAAELLGRATHEPVPSETVERLHRASAGNPLALLELAPEAARLEGPPEAPVPVSTTIARAFLRRVGALPERTRRILVLAAASDSGELAGFDRAAASLALDVGDLGPAESAGLVRFHEGSLEFRHPLARSAIYAEAPADERRAAHRALADALPDRDLDRRAWHLALAALGPDDAASAALEQAGVRARGRSAYAVAAATFERAARLAPDDDRRGRLLVDAAEAAWLAGSDRADALLAEAGELAPAGARLVRIEHLRGHLAARRGPVMHGYEILLGAADHAAAVDRELAVAILAEAVEAGFFGGAPREMLDAARRARDVLPADASPRTVFLAETAEGIALILGGDADSGIRALRRAIAVAERATELRADPRLLSWLVIAPLFVRESEAGRALVDAAVETARARTALGVLPYLLALIARDHAATDHWATAEAEYDEAIRLAREAGQRTVLAMALAGLAWLEARRGRETDSRAHATEAREVCAELGVEVFDLWAIRALGELELALGRPAEAALRFEEQVDRLRELGIGDIDVSPAAELVETYLRLGHAEDAAAAADELERQARAKGQPWSLARAARCRGLLAGDAEFDGHFEKALALHTRTPDVFETARTRLAYGARLRRARRRVRAREELRAALDIFDRLSAAPWAELARVELEATGETARRRDVSTLDALTPQELQIAQLLAAGKTTREAAAALFLSPKTVEYHLRHVYRKLGVGSRGELAAALTSR